MTTTPCRLLILDDHRMLVQGLALLVAEQPDLLVVGQFTTAAALLTWLEKDPPPPAADVLLLDLYLPAPEGLMLLPSLRQQWPTLRVLVFSTEATPALMRQLREAGGQGFVSKAAEAAELLATIRAVHAGQIVFPNFLVHLPAETHSLAARLSGREREIVGLVRQGLTTREMAEQLFLSEFTVSTHRRNIMHKLELPNVAALVQFALKNGL